MFVFSNSPWTDPNEIISWLSDNASDHVILATDECCCCQYICGCSAGSPVYYFVLADVSDAVAFRLTWGEVTRQRWPL